MNYEYTTKPLIFTTKAYAETSWGNQLSEMCIDGWRLVTVTRISDGEDGEAGQAFVAILEREIT